MSLAGKVAIVTGGGTGIGRAIGLALGREGASVVVNYSRSEAEATATVQEIRALGTSALAVQADVSQNTQVRAMVNRATEEYGKVDILVNNAATTAFVEATELDALTEEIWDRILAVNLKGTFFCSRAVTTVMRQAGGGCIINTASVAGLTGTGSCMAYAASKGAIITLTKSLARALAPKIRVNAIAPGFVDTRWTAHWSDYRAEKVEAALLKKAALPEDIAEGALYLARAEFVTGQTIVLDGGRVL